MPIHYMVFPPKTKLIMLCISSMAAESAATYNLKLRKREREGKGNEVKLFSWKNPDNDSYQN